MATSEGCEISVVDRGGRVVVSISGELDLPAEGALSAATDLALRAEPERVEIDLRELTFFGVCGISMLLRAAELCKRAGIELTVVATGRVRRVLDLAGASDTLEIQART